MSFNGYVNKAPGGDFTYTSFTLNGVNVDDDDIVGSLIEMSNFDM